MPMAIDRTVEGVLDDAGRTQLIEKVTDAPVEVEGQRNEAFRSYVWEILEDVKDGMRGAPATA